MDVEAKKKSGTIGTIELRLLGGKRIFLETQEQGDERMRPPVLIRRTFNPQEGTGVRFLNFSVPSGHKSWFPCIPSVQRQSDPTPRSFFRIEMLPPHTFDIDRDGDAGGHGAADNTSILEQLVFPGNYEERDSKDYQPGESKDAYVASLPAVLAACRESHAHTIKQQYDHSVEQLVGCLFEFFVSKTAVLGYTLEDFDGIASSPESWLVWADCVL